MPVDPLVGNSAPLFSDEDRPSQDFDLVVEGDAIALGKALARKNGA